MLIKVNLPLQKQTYLLGSTEAPSSRAGVRNPARGATAIRLLHASWRRKSRQSSFSLLLLPSNHVSERPFYETSAFCQPPMTLSPSMKSEHVCEAWALLYCSTRLGF